ncbi:putative ribonuclease H-like domain-containing protein, partial [Tanacetum coccineum]
MRPFGCHVTILNTLDYLGKFDGKSNEGFFVGYSMNSRAFRVYNIRTRKVEENLHIRFLEDKPIIACDGPKWLFDIDVLTKSMNYVSVVAGSSQDYILMPLWKDGLLFDFSLKNVSNDEPQPPSNAGKKDDEGVCKESGIEDQERPKNSTQDVNTVGPKVNMSNITTIYLVLSTLNTRIHKDHSLDNVIGDVQSGIQTRRMTKTTNEQGFISSVNEGKSHEDLHTWRASIVFRNKKDERGIVIWKKARLVAQGYTQEEGIDYDEVFTLVARIKAIRLFLAYASFMGFMVYQMDMKIAFLYGRIEEEVYVCQPTGFEDLDYPDKVYKVVKALYGLHQAPRAWSLVPRNSPFDLVAYSDSDYAGASLDRKSTTGAEYVAAASCYGQVLWIQNQMLNYGHVKRGWDTKIPQSSGPPIKVGDEAVHKELGDKIERGATTASSLEAEQDS